MNDPVNSVVLVRVPVPHCYWLTFREAQRQGGQVRKGERATPVIYWKWRTPEELAQWAEQTGKEDIAPCTPFVSAVFNFDQVEGVARPADDLPPRPADRLTVAEQIRLTSCPTSRKSSTP